MIIKTFGKVKTVNMVTVSTFLLTVTLLDKDNKVIMEPVKNDLGEKTGEQPKTAVFQAENMTRHTASAYKNCNVQISHERGENKILGVKITALTDNIEEGPIEI